MPEAHEELARLKWLLDNGKIPPSEPCKLVLPRIEARERVKNPKGRTRFVLECDTEDMYARFNAEKNRWLEGRNKSVVLDAMCRVWEEVSTPAIDEFTREG